MAETTMEPWSFTIVFDEDKAKKNGYEVDSDGSELPGDWEYDRKGGYVYCSFS